MLDAERALDEIYVLAGATPLLVHNCNANGEAEVRIPEWATDAEAQQFADYVDAATRCDVAGSWKAADLGRYDEAGEQ
jgi:hypothetical protein